MLRFFADLADKIYFDRQANVSIVFPTFLLRQHTLYFSLMISGTSKTGVSHEE